MSSKDYVTATLYGGWVGNARPWQISWHYEIVSLADPPVVSNLLPQTIANAIHDRFNTAPDPTLADVLSTGVISTWLEVTTTYPPGFYPYGREASFIGTAGTGDLLPEGMGPLVLFETGFPSEEWKRPSRLYWPGCAEALQNGGALSQAYCDILQTFWSNLENFSITITGDDYDIKQVLLSPSNEAKSKPEVLRATVSNRISRTARRGRVNQGRIV